MKKYLITGFSGFVSRHFIEFLDSFNVRCAVLGIDLYEPDFDYRYFLNIECSFSKVNLLEREQIECIVSSFHPDYILHLASYSSVSFSWKNPVASFSNNTNIFLNLIEEVRKLNIRCRILSIGSSEEYGNISADMMPLPESYALHPVSPYAVARVSQEMLSKVYVESFGMDIVLTRSFNHIGPGQKDAFVVSSFAKQLVTMKANGLNGTLRTGDTTIIRDFLDVRDVVKAYYCLFMKGRKGEIYNVCSGNGVALNEVIRMMADILRIDIDIAVDFELVRPNDNKIIVGNNEKIKLTAGWEPCIRLEQSLSDIIDYWKAKI